MNLDDTHAEPEGAPAPRPAPRGLGLVDPTGETRLSGAAAPAKRAIDPGLADTRISGEAAPGLADTHATETARPRPEVTDAELGLQRTLDSGSHGRLGRPELDDPEERRRRQALKARLFGDAAEAATIGRFRVLERLGAGGMGVVYAAYDDRLDRKVAIKVLRPDTAGEASKLRLMREAQAMARLSHPNIVGVHEVGEDAGSVFVAMEFIRGESLDAWLEQPRPWREILDVFVQAGRGLQAAHEAGLVHRDFKPANAILADDGRVKVLDFGLACAGEAAPPDPAAPGEAGSMLAVRLTRTGSMMGTPAYMSPEQHLGADVTAASDQFSFFVALYEALYGAPPFPTDDLVHLIAAVLEKPPIEPPAAAGVPAWIRAVVWRGLEKDPTKRFPDMAAALAALSRDPQRRRLRLAAITGLMLASAGASAAIVSAAEPAVGRCEGLAARVDPVWNDARVAAARSAFTANAGALGAGTWALLEPRLAAWVDAWTSVRADRCRALADGQLSEALHDRSVACLERQLARLDGLFRVFVAADAAAIEQAPSAVAALPAPAGCADAEFLLSEVPPPDDFAARAAVARGREALEQARASIDLGRFDDALARAGAVAGEARTLQYDPLLALAEAVRGDALQWKRDDVGADAALSAALELGLASGDDRVAAEALARRIFVRAELAGQPERALADRGIGRALLRRAGADPRLSWLFANNLAVAHERATHYDEAAARYEEALHAADALGDSIEGVYTRHNLGLLFLRLARFAEARALLADATAAAGRIFGADHPALLSFMDAEINLAQYTGRLRDADMLARRTLQMAARLPAANPGLVLPIVEIQARIAFERRDDDAARLAEQAESLARETYGPEHPRTAFTTFYTLAYRPERAPEYTATLAALSTINPQLWADSLINHARALLLARKADRVPALLAELRAPETWHKLPSGAHVGLALVEVDALLDLGRTREAAAALDALPADSEDVRRVQQRVEYHRGRLAWLEGQPDVAVAHLRRAVDGYRASFDDDHPEFLAVRLALARALHAAGAAQEADALAARLRDVYRSLGPRFAGELAALDDLAARPARP